MAKANKILAKIAAIALIVIGACGIATIIACLIGGDFLGVLSIILYAGSLSVGILLLKAKDLASVKFIVLISIAALVLILLRAIYGGVYTLNAPALFALISSAIYEIIAYVFYYGIIAIILVAIAAIVLNVIQRVKK